MCRGYALEGAGGHLCSEATSYPLALEMQRIRRPDTRHPDDTLAWAPKHGVLEGLRLLTQLIGHLPAAQRAAVCQLESVLSVRCRMFPVRGSSRPAAATGHKRGHRVNIYTSHGAAYKMRSTACNQAMALGRGSLSAGPASRAAVCAGHTKAKY